ncbi:MAG TPA: DUF4126 domain-containing protein [Longimicrobiales bacterium]
MITAPLIIFGQILGFAFAAGLNLYATIALVGMATRFGWIAGLPPAVQGVENPVVLVTAGALYFIEFLIDKIPYADTVWDIMHTVVRPLAATLLVSAALAEASLPVQLSGALLAGTVALGAHGLKAGLRLILNLRPRKILNVGISVLEDVFAVAMAVAVLMYPVIALGLASVAVPLMMLCGPRLWRVAMLALQAFAARFRGFFGRADWRDTDDLPERLRTIVAPPALGRGKPRVVRAAVRGVKGVGSYKNGWVVLSDGQPVFVYLSLMRPRSLPLPLIHEADLHRGVWTDTVEFENSKSRFTLFLLKDGPPADIALAALRGTTT